MGNAKWAKWDKKSVRVVVLAVNTHPDTATLIDPLFAFGGKRVTRFIKPKSFQLTNTLFTACGREGGQAKRRPGESACVQV